MTGLSNLRLEKRPDGVAIVWFDTPGSVVNVLSRELLAEIGPILDDLERDGAIRAVVLASAKRGTFIAGADLAQLIAFERAEDGEAFSRDGHALLDRIAGSSKPVVAAIDGAALGGGLEVALACHYLIASDNPRTTLALPEVQLGLLPGGGGCQRLPRRIGLAAALPMVLIGKRLRARQALRAGLVDAVTSAGGIVETAARAASDLAAGRLAPRPRRRTLLTRALESRALRGFMFRKAEAEVLDKTRGLYPAPPAILECVRVGIEEGFAAGARREQVRFGELAASPEAKGLIGLFHAMNELKKPPVAAPPRTVRRVAILGGGFMGTGVAQVSISAAPTTVRDLSQEVLAASAKAVWDGLERRVRSHAITRFERDRDFARLRLTTDARDLAGADLVIEAVFEDLALKRRVLAETEERIAGDAVFASNTSALPIAEIAREARRPERILGMHYFSPVPKMPLLEIVVTPATAEWAVATAHAFGTAQGKTCIVVRDGPGFYTSRILSPYLNEALTLLDEGARVEDVDRALLDLGFPVGPLALLDEVGIDVAAHVGRNFGDLFAYRGLGSSAALARLDERGYKGRKNRRGFYRYDAAKRRGARPVNDEVYALFGGGERRDLDAEEAADRLALLMANEAVHCLEEGVLTSPRDGDVGAVLGLGFPPFTGGPFRWIDRRGSGETVAALERLRARLGERFAPAPMLSVLAKSGFRFHGEVE